MTGPNDAQLIRQVLAGDRDVYAQLVDRYRDRLGRYALRMLGERADAEDAVQETFVRAYRSLSRCEPDNFGAWVYGILVNRCRTNGARRARNNNRMVADEAAMARASVPHSEERDTLRDAIRWALDRLPTEQREAFLLKHVEDLSYETMEQLTGVRPSALRMRVLRARDGLRKLLAEAVRD